MAFVIKKLFRKHEIRVLMVGLDAAGRTTILYKLKLGETVTTIPTIGFNVETIEYKKINFTIWDVGGCDKIRPLWRHYYQNTQALIFVVDSNDKERINEVSEELNKMLREDELKDAILLVFANKQDLPGAMNVEEITDKLGLHSLGSKQWYIQTCCATTGEGLYEGLNWLADILTQSDNSKKSNYFSSKLKDKENIYKQPSEEELLKIINEGSDIPESSEEFYNDFKNGKIHRFDHRSHLRIGFIVLYRAMKEGIKPSQAVENFIQVLKSFFEKADKSQIRLTFHITMTIFWCHIINLALRSFIDDETYNEKLSEDELFILFLTKYPSLSWSGLWRSHYSKDKLMNKEAKENFILPDLKPFPAYMTLQNKKSSPCSISNHELSDDKFEEYFNDYLLQEFNENDLIRICFIKLKYMGNTRRSIIVDFIMEHLQKLLMRLRSQQKTELIFSQTHTYFWIQIINLAILSLEFNNKDNKDNEYSESIEDLSFYSFKILFPELSSDKNIWKIYYSDNIFNSMEARRLFVSPDKKSLPNFFTKKKIDNIFIGENIQRVPLKILKNISHNIKDIIDNKIHTKDNEKTIINGWELDNTLLLEYILNGKLDYISHIDMIRMIYLHITKGWEKGERGTLAVTRIVDNFEKYWDINNHKSNDIIQYNNNKQTKQDIEESIFNNRYLSCYSGITHLHFWIQIITEKLTKSTYFHQNALNDFYIFIETFPELLWDRLWSIYYSFDICFSSEAKVMLIPPDINALSAFIRTKKS